MTIPKQYLPSNLGPSPLVKKIIGGIVGIIILALIIVWLVNFIQNRKLEHGVSKEASIVAQGADALDTDEDGVPDWEEVLFGLDPKAKETVPGNPDAVVIANIRQQANDAKQLERDLSSLGETTKLGLILAGQIQKDIAAGTTDNETALTNLYFETDKALQAKENSLKPYTTDSFELKIPDDDPTRELESYIVTTKKIAGPVMQLLDPIAKNTQGRFTEETSASTPIDTGTASVLKGIEDRLARETVPTTLSDIHLALMNSIATTRILMTKPVAADPTEKGTDLILLQKALVAFGDAYGTMLSYLSYAPFSQ